MSARITPVRRALAYAPARRGFLRRGIAALVGGAALVGFPRRASAASQPFIGEVMLTAAFYAPDGWKLCDGSLLSIGNYWELFSLLGTMYGGDGKETFAVPDLRGRVAMHVGQGPGLTNRSLGEMGGDQSHLLLASQIPQHDHAVMASSASGTSSIPTGLHPAQHAAGNLMYGTGPDAVLGAPTSETGAYQPHQNMQPFLGLNYCIAYTGIYPSRS